MLHKKVITPSLTEVEKNPRSRSARLRAAIKQGPGLLAIGVLALCLLAALQVGLSAQIATTGRQIKSLEDEKKAFQLDVSRLKQTAAELSSMSQIEARARGDLGMIKIAQEIEYVVSPRSDLLAHN